MLSGTSCLFVPLGWLAHSSPSWPVLTGAMAVAMVLALVWMQARHRRRVEQSNEELRHSEEETRRAFEALRESEAKFRLLFESTSDAFMLLDPAAMRYIDCNEAAVRMSRGGSKEWLLSQPIGSMSSERQRDGQRSEDKAKELSARALREGTQRFEWTARTFQGEEFDVDVILTPIRLGDRPLLVSVGRDISERKKAEDAAAKLNQSLERHVHERTIELVLANKQLTSEIADRRRTEGLLKQSEERLRTLVEHAPEAIVVFDGDSGRFLVCNENASRLYGLTREELLRRGPWDVSPPKQPDGQLSVNAAQDKIKEALAGGTPVFEWMHCHSSGRLLPCEVRLVRLPSEGQSLVRGSVIDNTERQRRQAIQKAVYEISEAVHTADDLNDLYRSIHRTIQGLMPARNFYLALHDPVGDLHYYAYHMDEVDARPAPRKMTSGLNGYVLHTGKALLVNRASMMDSANEWHMRSGSPSAIWLGVPLRVRGKTIGVMAVQDYHDERAYGEEEKRILTFVAEQIASAIERKQTEVELRASEGRLRESEARFSAAFHASPVYITIARVSDGRFVEANEAFIQWSGFGRDEIIGRTSVELGLWADLEERGGYWKELSDTGRVRNRECQLRNERGTHHVMLLSADIIQLHNEPHVLTVGLDISERKIAEAELLRALGREKELSQLKSNFVSMVSHEFRTPLGIIMSSAQILADYLERLEPAERAVHLDSIQKNVRQMTSLMEEVLLLGQVEAGKMECQPALLDLPALCHRLVDEVNSATNRICPVALALPMTLDFAHADERLLRHIFLNLLSNAVKYSEPGRTVKWSVRREGLEAQFEVSDQGIGIPEADLEWLFQAFHRGRNVAQRPGTGLGLTIVKRCVELHGGRIKVSSTLGQGTTVTVRLPLFEES